MMEYWHRAARAAEVRAPPGAAARRAQTLQAHDGAISAPQVSPTGSSRGGRPARWAGGSPRAAAEHRVVGASAPGRRTCARSWEWSARFVVDLVLQRMLHGRLLWCTSCAGRGFLAVASHGSFLGRVPRERGARGECCWSCARCSPAPGRVAGCVASLAAGTRQSVVYCRARRPHTPTRRSASTPPPTRAQILMHGSRLAHWDGERLDAGGAIAAGSRATRYRARVEAERDLRARDRARLLRPQRHHVVDAALLAIEQPVVARGRDRREPTGRSRRAAQPRLDSSGRISRWSHDAWGTTPPRSRPMSGNLLAGAGARRRSRRRPRRRSSRPRRASLRPDVIFPRTRIVKQSLDDPGPRKVVDRRRVAVDPGLGLEERRGRRRRTAPRARRRRAG